MNDDQVWARDEIASPCVKLCTIHPEEQICTGCFRTLQEIGGWSAMDNATRLAIMQELPDRAPRLTKRRGGRAAKLRDRS